ncbi:hypothetical protein K7X08_024027 [Anisodus acutangulus]|uniref:RING-type E3 ubiquitin transferase (cysteine targeting) n=1 Tax=Anisodus acutangulus TaxID=402998 RepID=A0A9Q1MA11_9SOLA|nr:hypothetical protein K7X08_024027 [Anisodus acutangulus]
MPSIRPLTRGPRLLRGPHRTEICLLVVDVSGGRVSEECCGKVKLRFVDREDAMNADYVPLVQIRSGFVVLPVSLGRWLAQYLQFLGGSLLLHLIRLRITSHGAMLWMMIRLRLPSESAIPISISRVNQVDAGRLDIEMSAMLKEQLVKVVSLMKECYFNMNQNLMLSWNSLSGGFLSGGKVRTGLEGPGLTAAQKIWYCVATVGGQYMWARLQSFSAFRRWGDSVQRSVARRAWLLIQHMEGIYKAAAFSNLLLFLYTGRYRNLIEIALRARLVYGSPNMNRAVSFEHMNHQLVWNEFSELLLLLLPLLNSSSVKNILRPFSKDKSSDSSVDDTLCPICQGKPTIPFLAILCQHSYCYYCLQTRCSASPSFRCPRYGELIADMQRHGGSVNNIRQKQ